MLGEVKREKKKKRIIKQKLGIKRMDRVSSRPKCVLYCQEATWRWKG